MEDVDAHAQDSAVYGSDTTAFKGGVMSLGAPASRSAPKSGVAAAPAPLQGEGWKLGGVTKWLQTGYTIKFYDQKSADWLAPYVQASAADLRRITNLPVTVDTRPVGWDYSRPRGEVVIGVAHRPCLPPDGDSMGNTGWKVVRDGSGMANLSCGFTSSSLPDTATSGHAYIDDEFFTPAYKPTAAMGETYMRNHISHELGHTLGLAHANRSMDKSDCAKGSDSGEFPVMCSCGLRVPGQARQAPTSSSSTSRACGCSPPVAGAVLAPQGKVTGIGSKCLDVKGGKAANGTQIQLYTCNGSAAQSWILGKDGTLRALGKCLDDARNAGANGDKISLYDCNGTPAQRWSVNAKGQIVHVASGKVLDVTGGSTANGTAVQLYTANANKRQVWVTPK